MFKFNLKILANIILIEYYLTKLDVFNYFLFYLFIYSAKKKNVNLIITIKYINNKLIHILTEL